MNYKSNTKQQPYRFLCLYICLNYSRDDNMIFCVRRWQFIIFFWKAHVILLVGTYHIRTYLNVILWKHVSTFLSCSIYFLLATINNGIINVYKKQRRYRTRQDNQRPLNGINDREGDVLFLLCVTQTLEHAISSTN